MKNEKVVDLLFPKIRAIVKANRPEYGMIHLNRGDDFEIEISGDAGRVHLYEGWLIKIFQEKAYAEMEKLVASACATATGCPVLLGLQERESDANFYPDPREGSVTRQRS